jgi:hypothetical protein
MTWEPSVEGEAGGDSESRVARIIGRPIFVVGAPRSGTTWVQRLLLSSPAICGGQETHFFNSFAGVLDAYQQSQHLGRRVGLCAFWDEPALIDEIRRLWRKTVEPLVTSATDAKVLVEKTPDHAIVLPQIFKCLPDAKVIHVIRDSRSVVASLIAASNDWGSFWAPSSARKAAILWYNYVRLASNFGRTLPPDRYMEVFYEDLMADTVSQATRLFKFAGVAYSNEQIIEAVEAQKFDVQKRTSGTPIPVVKPGDSSTEPAGFFRKGQIDSWRSELSLTQKMVVWRFTRKLMAEFGYSWSGRAAGKTTV